MKRKLLFYILLFCSLLSAQGQTLSVVGEVQDSVSLKPISGAIVMVCAKANGAVISYTTTGGKGEFALQVAPDKFATSVLKITNLGYAPQTLALERKAYRVKLQAKDIALKEVIVKGKKILQKQDTTTYIVGSFAKKKDRTIGEVLENMPGISVNSSGTISYKGDPINKLFIEGMDVLNGRYAIATNNIAHKNIGKVEVIENYQSVRSLRDKKPGRETVINLTVKEEAKSRWTGSALAKLGASPSEVLGEGALVASQFSAHKQTINTIKANNSGKDIMSESVKRGFTIEEFLYMLSGNQIGAHISASPTSPPHIRADAARRNQTYTANTSHIWKLSEYTILRAQAIYAEDRNKYDQASQWAYFLRDSTLSRAMSQSSKSTARNLETSLNYKIDNPNYQLDEQLTYSGEWNRFNTQIYGDLQNLSTGSTHTFQLENTLKFIKPIGKSSLHLISKNIYTSIPEQLDVMADRLRTQSIKTTNFYSDTHAQMHHRMGYWGISMNADLYANIYNLDSHLSQSDEHIINDVGVNYLAGRLVPTLSFERMDIRLEAQLPFSLYRFSREQEAKKAYFNPSLFVKWLATSRWTLSLSGSLGTSYAGSSLFYTRPMMLDYQTLNAGVVDFTGNQGKSLNFRVAYANPGDMLFGNLEASHSVTDIRWTTAQQVTPTYIYYSFVPTSGQSERWNVGGNISKGVDLIDGKIDLASSYSRSKTPIQQNGSAYTYSSEDWKSSAQLKSSLADWLDLSYRVSYQWSNLRSAFSTSSTHYLSQQGVLTLYPWEGFHASLTASDYLTVFGANQRKHFFLADLSCSYRYRKVDLLLTISNIWDQRYYSFTHYGTLSSRYSQYELRPRNILLGVNWYF